MIGHGDLIRQREKETLSPPLTSVPWPIIPLPSVFSGDGESLSSIYAQPGSPSLFLFLFLPLPWPCSLSFSLSFPRLLICDLSNQ